MPLPVPSWVAGTPLSAKSLVLAAYTCDGSGDHPNGIVFNTLRPVLFEAYTRTPSLTTSTGGTQTALSTSGSTTGGLIVVDSAGYFGMTQDQPIAGYYEFLPAVNGSAGDGQTAGGWTLISHMAAVAHGATQTSVSADLLGTGGINISGTRQAPSSAQDSTAFFLDLVNAGTGVTWQPAVTIRDSGAAAATTVVSSDGSGETCRLCAIWAAVSATSAGQAVFNINGTYPFTAPGGVFAVTATNTGAGGGGEEASGTVAVTPFNNYTVIVGAGGAGGTAPTSNAGSPGPGAVGGNCVFTGDAASVTAHGGSGGSGATGTANGTGGAGGAGSGATTHHNGGAGAAGGTGFGATFYGGGGGSSAAPATAGTTATGPQGAHAPTGGGPGGNGGAETISVVQVAQASNNGPGSLKVVFDSALQAGNTVIAMVYHQSFGPTMEPVLTLSDGTPFGDPAVTADVPAHPTLQNGLYNAFNVPGGETSLTIKTDPGGPVTVIIACVLEVAGLGPSPGIDQTASHTQGPASPDQFYDSAPGTGTNTSDAPEIWVAWTGAQSTPFFSVNNPAKSLGWTTLGSHGNSNGGVRGAGLGAYQIRTAAGNMHFTGTFSKNVTKGTVAAAYFSSAATTGAAPVIGPGGGGGGGLGVSNNGGNGSDGQVTLTWTGASGSGYGTPQLPAPFTNWSDATAVGTTSSVDVNVNSNTGIRDVLNFLANPPVLRVSQAAGTSIPASTLTQVPFTSVTPTVDNYTGWSSGTYTVRRDGLYLFHGLVSFAAGASGAVRAAAATINGTSYWGPPAPPATAGTTNVAKTQVFDLKAGDTVSLSCFQSGTGALALDTGNQTRFLLAWLGELGPPATAFAAPFTFTPPDTTFQWAAATLPTAQGGNLTALLQQHLGNDLSFLVNRPYLLAHAAPGTGLTASAFSPVSFNSDSGQVHVVTGDNYGGFGAGPSGVYTAQAAGWYLCAGEIFITAPASSGPTVIAGLQLSSSGGVTPANPVDYYQQNTATTSASFGGGAAIYGLVYLNVGESVTPMINGQGYSGTYNMNTNLSLNGGILTSHMEMAWMSS